VGDRPLTVGIQAQQRSLQVSEGALIGWAVHKRDG
jgi:hypothetical protein